MTYTVRDIEYEDGATTYNVGDKTFEVVYMETKYHWKPSRVTIGTTRLWYATDYGDRRKMSKRAYRRARGKLRAELRRQERIWQKLEAFMDGHAERVRASMEKTYMEMLTGGEHVHMNFTPRDISGLFS